MDKRHVTQRDIARAAGVSRQTVSLVIQNSPLVKEETRRKVQKVISKMGYAPSHAGRSLVTGKTGTIGVVSGDIVNPYWSEIIQAAELEARGLGYEVLLKAVPYEERGDIKYVESLLERRVDGVLFLPILFVAQTIADRFRQAGVATVFRMNDASMELDADAVVVDLAEGASVALSHLLEAGHRDVAFILLETTSKSRLPGFRKALGSQGMVLKDDSVFYLGKIPWDSYDEGYREGYRAAREVFARRPRPSALIAECDIVAIGAMSALSDMGLRIGKDVAVVAFDDLPTVSYACAPLTTVRQPKAEIGRAGIALLDQRIRNGLDSPSQRVILHPELAVRASGCLLHDKIWGGDAMVK